MLLVWLAACTPEASVGWSNLVVTTTEKDPAGLLVSQQVDVYDDVGRMVSSVSSSSQGTSEARIVYDGACAVRTSFTLTAGGVVTLATEQSVDCDDVGDPVLSVEETTVGDAPTRTTTYTWENEHDEEERLTRTELWADGVLSRTETYTWAECVDPTLAHIEGADGSVDERTVDCREDGQPVVEALVRVEASDGTPAVVGATDGYDVFGHRVSRTEWEGEEEEMTGTRRYSWADPAGPGPTEALAFQGDELVAQWSIAYE